MIDYSKIMVFVLAPQLNTNNENIDYYYDFSQSITEYTTVFATLQMHWQWQNVTIKNYITIIDNAIATATQQHYTPVFLNLCDGDEINDTPGISVIQYLQQCHVMYTGSNEYFYHITTSKAAMKYEFEQHNISTAAWKHIKNINEVHENIFAKNEYPIIVKPSISAGSMGIGIKNVVHNFVELQQQVSLMFNGYKGWNLGSDGIVAEQFINGNEYTTLITGDFNVPQSLQVYIPVQRVFHSSLKDEEKFLSFDRLWEIYEDETAMPNNENFYEYDLPQHNVINAIQQISVDAYKACKGIGYGRVDIRMNNATQQLYVLEVNAQCGLSDDENFTSIGAILKYNKVSFTSLIQQIIDNAIANNYAINK